MKISQSQFDRLRIMYAFDLATKWGSLKPKDVFINPLSPEWIKMNDVFGNYTKDNLYTRYRKMLKELNVGQSFSVGCFKLKRTKKSFIVYTELARIPL